MKVKNPLMSVEARGQLAGFVFNTWRGINYVKANTSPTGQGTEKRLIAQALLAQVARLWQGLSQANRDAWSTYATDHPVTDWTGQPKRLTGMNWFCKTAANLLACGASVIDTPPEAAGPDAPTEVAIALTDDDLTIAWTAPVTGSGKIDVWYAGPMSPGVSPKIEQAQRLALLDPDETTPYEIVTLAAAGRHAFFVRYIDEQGLASPWVLEYEDVS